ncbi:MAG TPA: hypothetical protein VK742_07310 [Candidatus Sulfotelmatobacter sp.]|jgi:hypothetical protein|nr:hypothetical protein [Candidatus Sulfotelmatobacter sp.]
MIILLVLFYEAMVTAITSVGCKLYQKWHRQAGWYVGLVGAVLTAALISLPSDWHYLTHPQNWSWERRHDKQSLSAVLYGFLWLTGMALPVALFVVYFFRKKHRDRAMQTTC